MYDYILLLQNYTILELSLVPIYSMKICHYEANKNYIAPKLLLYLTNFLLHALWLFCLMNVWITQWTNIEKI